LISSIWNSENHGWKSKGLCKIITENPRGIDCEIDILNMGERKISGKAHLKYTL